MRARYTDEKRGAYVIRLPDISKMWELLENQVGGVKASADCSDGASRIFNDWDEIASYDNFSQRQITGFSLRAHSRSSDDFASIEFMQRPDREIQVVIECSDEKLLFLKEQIFGILDGTRHQILSYFVGKDLVFFVVIPVLLYVVISLIGRTILFGTVIPHVDVFFEELTLLSYILFIIYAVVLSFAASYGLSRLRSNVIPAVYFAIGQGELRYDNWKARWQTALSLAGVIIGITGLIGGIIISILD